jgi:rhodanese-related sulfurtransferase
MKNKVNYKIIFLILLISIVLAFIYNTFSVDGVDLIRKPIIVKSVTVGEGENESNSILGLDLAQTINLFNQNVAIFIDARDQWEFSESHISGAINIPEFSFSKDDSLLKTISHEKLLVIYCDGNDCDTSKRLANEIVNLGYKNVYVFLGGFKVWREAQLPITKGNTHE